MAYSPKGRTARADLTEADVRSIRSRAALGISTRQLAQEYTVGFETIRRILRWETWRWVSEEGSGAVLPPPASPAEIEASKARFLAMIGDQAPPSSMPSMADSLAAAARESDEVAARVAQDFAKKQAEGDAQLAGLLDSGGIQCSIPNVNKEKLSVEPNNTCGGKHD